MSDAPILIATRGSDLALAQANQVLRRCQAAFPELGFQVKIIKTTGDKLQTASLTSANLPKGLFTKELESALLANQADLAVHSLKDLPTELPPGLTLGAVLEREDVRDVLVYRGEHAPASQGQRFVRLRSLKDLPPGARLATSSTRRAAQARELRPDLHILPIRGNVPTRLKKLCAQPEIDALLLAAAGLHRLGYRLAEDGPLQLDPTSPLDPFPDLMAVALSPEEMLPCVGQGAIAVEIVAGSPQATNLCRELNDWATSQCVAAERSLLRALGGGCQLPLGAWAQLVSDQLHLQAIWLMGPRPRRAEASGAADQPDELGRRVALLLQ